MQQDKQTEKINTSNSILFMVRFHFIFSFLYKKITGCQSNKKRTFKIVFHEQKKRVFFFCSFECMSLCSPSNCKRRFRRIFRCITECPSISGGKTQRRQWNEMNEKKNMAFFFHNTYQMNLIVINMSCVCVPRVKFQVVNVYLHMAVCVCACAYMCMRNIWLQQNGLELIHVRCELWKKLKQKEKSLLIFEVD